MITKSTKHLHRRNLSLKYLIYNLFFFSTTTGLIIYFPPTYQISIMHIKLPVMIPFFIVFFLLLYCLGILFLRRKKHGLIIASFVVSYLLFRLNNLTHPLFLFLLLALFLVAEFLFTQHDNK